MTDKPEVSVRERVKLPPAERLIEAYFAPNLARGLTHGFAIEIWCHLAHALMLEHQGIIAAADSARLRQALLALHEAGPDMLGIDGRQEDLYSYIERHLTRTLGPETGGRLHTGRSRNDLHTTTARMIQREKLLAAMATLNALRHRVLTLARTHAGTVMPGYTHWQHAQPITLGYYLLAFADVLSRDADRLRGALRHTNLSPLGSGALATTAFPLDRAMTADALGFDGLVEVAYDGVASRDDAHETVAAMAVLMTSLSRLCVDFQAWSTLEYRFIELGDQHCSVSSIMPQKKNPAALEHIKAAAGMVTGHLVAALSASKNTAFADVSDGVSAINAPVIEALLVSTRAMALLEDVLAALTVFPARMAHMAEIGYGTATELADVIVRETGLSFRMAHNVVASVVAAAIAAERPATSITSAELEAAAAAHFGITLALPPEIVAAALDPVANIAGRSITGGPAAANMASMLATRRVALEDADFALAAITTRISAARDRVFRAAER